MSKIVLYPFQEEIIEKVRHEFKKGNRRVLIQSPTGSGKTALTTDMLGKSSDRGISSVFMVHRRELVKQSLNAFKRNDINAGVISSGFPENPRLNVQVASIQTYIRRYAKLKIPSLIVWDECHHLAATNWTRLFKEYPDSFHVGLTATPMRLDGRGLDKFFDVMVQGPSVPWLIENRYLSAYRLFAPTNLSMDGVGTRMGDFIRSQVVNLVDKPTIIGSAVSHYLKLCPGSRNVVFCASVEHSEHTAMQFREAGIPAEHVDGKTDSIKRDGAIKRFERGETKVLCNVDLFGEGFDVPAIEAVTMLRPTQSLALYLQQVGRGLRRSAGKEQTIILDHVGNCERHGLPDEIREWSLSGIDKKSKGSIQSSSSIRICPKCFAAQFSHAISCNFCGNKFDIKVRKIEHQDGDLIEVNKEALKKKRKLEQGVSKTFDDLVALGISRGYKRPHFWAKCVHNARQRKKLFKG